MDTTPILLCLSQRLPSLMAVYAFGSQVKDAGRHANANSDLDLAVLVEGYADPLQLFDLAGELADIAHCHVDLLDIRAASTVMQNQILTQGKRWYAKDVRVGLFEAAMLNEKIYLDQARQRLVQEVMERGSVYGR
ncbi:type VII toxin-antitoxin system MntA family adenylyltransferase antitoxin [Limnohabitans sp.]|uniref:type VII toxin-antitoxin system MntA family adenylyltransferase antitoxin n=1 Tax=Limnohabitans sp. TaxID=1907725 RepID=UPI00286EF44F|nr:nucleotidyltransferase domain-containing protein [Limnohabitans sp.]